MGLFGDKKEKLKEEKIDWSKGCEMIGQYTYKNESWEDTVNRRIKAGRIVKNVTTSERICTIVYDLWAEKKIREEQDREKQGIER